MPSDAELLAAVEARCGADPDGAPAGLLLACQPGPAGALGASWSELKWRATVRATEIFLARKGEAPTTVSAYLAAVARTVGRPLPGWDERRPLLPGHDAGAWRGRKEIERSVEWRIVRRAEARGGALYVAALCHWATRRGRWLAARDAGDAAGMAAAAAAMRDALRRRGVTGPEIVDAMVAQRRVADAVLRRRAAEYQTESGD